MTFSETWHEWAKAAGAKLLKKGTKPAERFVIDSRSVRPGDVFVAVKGAHVDGHDFIKDAFARGAVGCVAAKAVKGAPPGAAVLQVKDTVAALQSFAALHRSRWPGRVIGITGSNGKTTTKEMLAQIFAAAERPALATRGNLNSQIGLPLTLLDLNDGHQYAVIEMGASAKGHIARLCGVAKPHVAVMVSVGRAHLEFFGSLKGVLAAKWELVESLPSDGLAFLNIDDEHIRSRRASVRCSVVTYGLNPAADVRAENIRQDPTVVFDLVIGGMRREIRLPVPGLFNVTNALAAAAVAVWERVTLQNVALALSRYAPAPQRMQMRRRPDGALFIVDAYNANPDSMGASIDSFVAAFPHWPRVAVLGSMLELGDHSEKEHRALGKKLASLPLEKIFFVGPESAWVKKAFEDAGGQAPFRAAGDKEAIRMELGQSITPLTVVLFKASRGVKLEELYEPLLNSN